MTRRALFQAALAIGVSDERDLHEFARRIFDRANELRSLRGAPVLQWREDLARCAREQSLRKAKLRFPGHNDPERGDIAQRLRTAGIPWTLCGENVFQERGWDDPVNFAIVFWWYSAGHQANMLNPAYTDSGVGLAQGLDGTYFATQIFVENAGYPPTARGRATNTSTLRTK